MSLTGQFDLVDSYIYHNQMKDAVKELKIIEKKVYDSWSCIGVYKRYIKIGENKLAEEVITKAIKKNPENVDLKAVYTDFLLNQNRIEEAVDYAVSLQGNPKYASLYSEAALKLLNSNSKLKDAVFNTDNDLRKIYLDAWTASKNHVWLRNAVLFSLKEGLFDNAASLMPNSFADADDAFFWGQILFDAGRYYESVYTLDLCLKYLQDYSFGNKAVKHASEIQAVALESDCFIALSEMEKAENIRQTIIKKSENLGSVSDIDKALLPVITINSALYADNTSDENAAADLLFECVTKWPDFVPGLLKYADFAYTSSQSRKEDEEMLSLRRNGLLSLEMERYDNRRIIPLSDAVFRIEESLKRQPNPYLSIAQLDLKYKMNSDLTIKEKTSDLWRMLEANYTESVKYQNLLSLYALSYLIKTNQIDEAYALFKRYIRNSYDVSEESFWEDFIRCLNLMDIKTAEFGAWFAAYSNLYDEVFRIYEYCVFESGGILAEGAVSPYVSTYSCMNLADVYFSTGKRDKALDLYGKVAGRESNSYLRSEIFYRIACIYSAAGDYKSALHSIDYAVQIYPGNTRANLLKTKIVKDVQ